MIRQVRSSIAIVAVTLAVHGCASGSAGHGNISSLSVASHAGWSACRHGVPEEPCTRCHPERIATFKARGDWCGEHGVPESQCLECHPDLDFSPPKEAPAQADVKQLVREGEDLPALEPHLVPGKITIFDFHAIWCPPCRKVDEHLFPVLSARKDVALRKIDIGSWDSPAAARWLAEVPELPYLLVYDRKGRRVAAIAGAKLAEIDRAIEGAGR